MLVGIQTGAAAVENSMEVPQKLKIELPHDTALPILAIYQKKVKTITWKDTGTPMFPAALCMIPTTWKQNKCLWTEE